MTSRESMNADLLKSPSTDPTSIYRYRDGLYAVDLLSAAISHLNFFTWLHDLGRPADLRTICQELDLRARPADVMLTMLTAMGLLEKADGAFLAWDSSICYADGERLDVVFE